MVSSPGFAFEKRFNKFESVIRLYFADAKRKPLNEVFLKSNTKSTCFARRILRDSEVVCIRQWRYTGRGAGRVRGLLRGYRISGRL